MKFSIYNFDKLKARFPNLKSTRQFILDAKYLGDVAIDITTDESEPDIKILYAAAFDVLGKMAVELEKPARTYRGTTNFIARDISKIFHDKVVNYSESKAGSIGEPQRDIDLTAEDWFAYNDNYGTSEEKNFVAYFGRHVEELKKIYDKIYLIRNERELAIYSFDDGARFEPDYVLFLQKENSAGFEQLQIFIEPKGEHLIEHDKWKEKFLLRLKQEAKVLADDARYRIWGLPFYNHDDVKNFDSAFKTLLD